MPDETTNERDIMSTTTPDLITRLICNWFSTTVSGVDYETYEVGHCGVVSITEHLKGGKLCYCIEYAAREVLEFNPCTVERKKTQ